MNVAADNPVSFIATHASALVIAGLVPAIRRGAMPLLMAGTVAGHDERAMSIITEF